MKYRIAYIFLLLLMPLQRVQAEPVSTFEQIEDMLIYNDYNKMEFFAKKIEHKLLSVQSVQEYIDLNQTAGLLYLHMGKKSKARQNFKASLDHSLVYFPDDSLKIASSTFFLLNSLDNFDFRQMNMLYPDILLNIATPVLPPDVKRLKSNTSHFLASEGCFQLYLNVFEGLEDKFEAAAQLSLKEMENGVRWARITYMMIMDCMISAQLSGGNYEDALETIDEFQKYLKLNYTNVTYYYASSLIYKAEVLHRLGNYEKALDALDFADRILLKRDVVTGILKARIAMVKGDIYFDKRSYGTAKIFYKSARRIWTYDIKDDNAQLKAMNREMESLFKNGDEESGMAFMKELDKLFETSENYTEFANYVRIFSEYMISNGTFSGTIDLLKTVTGSCDTARTMQLDYDNALKLRNVLGLAYQRAQRYDEAVDVYSDIIRDEKQRAHDIFAFLPEGQRELYWKKKIPVMDNIFRLNKADNNLCSKVLYDASLLNKGLLLEAFLNMQRAIMNSGDQELIDAFEELRKLQGSNPARAEALEKEIMSKLAVYEDFMDFTSIGWKDVRNGLRKNEAAIEFVVSESNGSRFYSAEVLRSDYEAPRHVCLFEISENDSSLMDIGVYSNTSLYDKIWGKLEKYISGCSHIYFAPAGDLYGVAIEYLPVNEQKRINDIYTICRLSSTKSLARRNNYKEVDANSAVLYGGLDYNLDSENMEFYAQLAKGGVRGASDAADLSKIWNLSATKWNYLKGTYDEVNNISKILDKKGCNIKTITAGEGVEESFKVLSGESPQVIHVATHGFFIKESKNMLKSTGLVFAGANNHNKNSGYTDDGFLTSYEIASMDLNGADLVVLSACQTALGEISGEGVFGLQRGFKKACAKTILMSLWEVEDNATSELMTSFYTNLSNGMDKTQALYNAQKHVMDVCGADPSLWAGFIILD